MEYCESELIIFKDIVLPKDLDKFFARASVPKVNNKKIGWVN